MRRPISLLLVLLSWLATSSLASSCDAAPAARPASPQPAASSGEAIAIFAGGCFWCMETQFEGLPGILSVVSGYAGGSETNPTYEQVSSGATGHYESIEIRYDPRVMRYERLLDLFWRGIDPTQGDGQFCDRGRQYRSAIFHRDETQRRLAEESKRRIVAARVLKKPVVTEILPAGPFYRAEEYHQDFWKKDPVRYQSYRLGCGRDRRLRELWGAKASKPSVH